MATSYPAAHTARRTHTYWKCQ